MLTERRFTVAGIEVAAWQGGAGFPLLLLHGSGPGASTWGNWRLVLEPLAARFSVLAIDLIGFGQSGRKPEEPYFDLDLWLAQAEAALDLLPGRQVGVIGHSLSGMLALRLAARQNRVAKVLTTGTMGAHFIINDFTRRTWTLPETRDALRLTAEGLVHDPAAITETYLDQRMAVLSDPDYARYFRAMFAGDRQAYVDAALLAPAELADLRIPITMVHGRDDKPFPFEATTLALARALPQADIVALASCGHSPALEHPRKVLDAAHALFGGD